ncbi:MAG: F-type H+-transporting ATPase subunit delta [Pseudohongiellaceae bacterium]|jgi:F-type H+-transporting ATPase subunit delta
MASTRLIANRYAKALHGLASEAGLLEQVEAQLDDLAANLASSDELQRQLANPRLGRDVKKAILSQLMGEAVDVRLRNTVMLMADKGRAGLLMELQPALAEIAMDSSGRAVATVVSAAPLRDEIREGLRAQLRELSGKEIALDETVDESLLGGMSVQIGSRMIDGSLKRRLEVLEHKMLGAHIALSSDS